MKKSRVIISGNSIRATGSMANEIFKAMAGYDPSMRHTSHDFTSNGTDAKCKECGLDSANGIHITSKLKVT